MNILFVQMGGTIDKTYPRLTKGWAFEIGDPAIFKTLARAKPNFSFEVATVCKKDSTEITAEDRNKLTGVIEKAKTDRIIVTHGTDTIIETARHLMVFEKKCIILTGARLPERFKDSDADFNLGVAVGVIQHTKPGVYVAMNGIVKEADKVIRNIETGQFS